VLLLIILASLTAIVLFFLLRPLVGRGGGEPAREAFNATVFRDQLEEIEADRARGLIGEAEVEAARLEIARRLLAADEEASGKSEDGQTDKPARVALVSVVLALPLAVIGLYLLYGSPRLPDQPLAARLTDPASEKNIGALVARVEARLRAHPEEGQGWDAIAPVYLTGGRYADAADAYRQAIRLLGPSAARLSGLGQALVLEKGGLVSEQARRALEEAVALDASLVEPRILLAIAKEEDGDYQAALEDWRGLLTLRGGDERWQAMVQKRIENAQAHLSGETPAPEAPPVVGGPGPSAADIAAAQNMTAADRQAMIEGMVQRLAARLDKQGDDLAGWLQLVRAYTVLGRNDEAREALARAKGQFDGDTQAIEQLDALAAELGFKS
jgi:cytochrome c-type biogenesis protein CcmH